jgi:hypothetical protein
LPNPPYTFGRRVAKLVEEVTDDKKKKLEKQERPALLKRTTWRRQRPFQAAEPVDDASIS